MIIKLYLQFNHVVTFLHPNSLYQSSEWHWLHIFYAKSSDWVNSFSLNNAAVDTSSEYTLYAYRVDYLQKLIGLSCQGSVNGYLIHETDLLLTLLMRIRILALTWSCCFAILHTLSNRNVYIDPITPTDLSITTSPTITGSSAMFRHVDILRIEEIRICGVHYTVYNTRLEIQ